MSTASATRNAGLAAATAAAPRSVLAAPELSTQELLIVAQSIAADSARWEPRVHHDPFQRTYHEVARTDTHSAWLICWMPGHDTGFHDHDGAGGVGLVLRGSVRESRLRVGGPAIERTCVAGEYFGFTGLDIHRVEHAGSAPAVTLHVYSPVLLRMGSYEIGENGALRRHMLDESQELRPLSA